MNLNVHRAIHVGATDQVSRGHAGFGQPRQTEVLDLVHVVERHFDTLGASLVYHELAFMVLDGLTHHRQRIELLIDAPFQQGVAVSAIDGTRTRGWLGILGLFTHRARAREVAVGPGGREFGVTRHLNSP